MTAASGADQPTLRDQLAEALMDARLIRWREPELAREYVDALLPLIEADRERAKAEGGAEALEKAAEELRRRGGALAPSFAAQIVDARAAALRGSTGGGT